MNNLKYVQRLTDRYGKERYYFRVRNQNFGRLPGEEGSIEFLEAYRKYYAELEAKGMPGPPGRPSKASAPLTGRAAELAFLPGSISWFVERYLVSREYGDFAAMTQVNYRAHLDVIRADIGAVPLHDVDTENLDFYIAGVYRQRGASAADQHLRLISNLWEFAKGFAEFKRKGKSNPTREARKYYRVKNPHLPWPKDLQEHFLAKASSSLVLAYHLLLYTGQRRGDVVAMKWTDIEGGRIKVRQEKTGEQLSLRIHVKLLAELSNNARVHECILTHKWGKPYTSNSLTHRVKEVLRAIGAEDYTLHGLRKNAGVALAENQATVSEIMSVLGHKSPKMAMYYVKEANKITLNDSAMDKWERAG